MPTNPPPISVEVIKELQELLEKCTQGEWGYNSYSKVSTNAYGNDEVDYPDGPRPGPPFYDKEDSQWMDHRKRAYLADPDVAYVPAHYGDSATDRHCFDATLIAISHNTMPSILDRLIYLEQKNARTKDTGKTL